MPTDPPQRVEPEVRLDAEDARAGKTGVGLRYVLGASLALTIVMMLVLLLGFGWRPSYP